MKPPGVTAIVTVGPCDGVDEGWLTESVRVEPGLPTDEDGGALIRELGDAAVLDAPLPDVDEATALEAADGEIKLSAGNVEVEAASLDETWLEELEAKTNSWSWMLYRAEPVTKIVRLMTVPAAVSGFVTCKI